MEELKKRLKSGAWVSFAGFLVTAIGIILEQLEVFELTPIEQAIAIALGTGLISQITKYLNGRA